MGRAKEKVDRLMYEWSWLRFKAHLRWQRFKIWLIDDVCWHIFTGGVFKRCVKCWLKLEMKRELNKEIDRQILYGDGN